MDEFKEKTIRMETIRRKIMRTETNMNEHVEIRRKEKEKKKMAVRKNQECFTNS